MRTLNLRRIVLLMAALILTAPLLYLKADDVSALSMTNRRLRLSNPEPGATSNYAISFDIQQLLSYGSIELEFCGNNPIPGQPCTPPVGFDATAAVLFQQSGETGFTIHPSSNANRIILSRAPAVPAVAASTYRFSGIVNPSNPQQTNYLRLSNFASIDATGARIDEGGVAFSTSDDFDINLFVPPYLSFCVATEIAGLNCSTALGNRIDFGLLSSSETRSDASEFVVTTNAALGYNVTVQGPTMTSGIHTIDNMTSSDASDPGSEQFGMNLRSNSDPTVGANPTGLVTGGPVNGYGVANQFKYNQGDIIASSNTPDASSYTSSYIVNVPADQAPGIYTTTLTYVAFASF